VTWDSLQLDARKLRSAWFIRHILGELIHHAPNTFSRHPLFINIDHLSVVLQVDCFPQTPLAADDVSQRPASARLDRLDFRVHTNAIYYLLDLNRVYGNRSVSSMGNSDTQAATKDHQLPNQDMPCPCIYSSLFFFLPSFSESYARVSTQLDTLLLKTPSFQSMFICKELCSDLPRLP
jgi:hypothetical protein